MKLNLKRVVCLGMMMSGFWQASPVLAFSQEDIWRTIRPSVEKLSSEFGLKQNQYALIVVVSHQKMYLIQGQKLIKSYRISTASAGIGSIENSDMTPPGTHRIKEKIGAGHKMGAIFKGRKFTGQHSPIYKDLTDLSEDLITTRILWLDGQENGVNRGGNRDSHRRYIYIHGTPEEGQLGKPNSKGCIRMGNKEVIELFQMISSGTLVEIQE